MTAVVGEYDHGHARGACASDRASERPTDEESTGWKKRELHKRRDVEEHFRTILVSVHRYMIPSGIWKDAFQASRIPRLRLALQ
ncbi:hypothetical protein CASFOL_040009 [Castilleja foliolosa]|uniref:Uncharacterized protein n=1 Tax=Castilleja foliolosa TaxID=1961234 RepID=A0ABD3BFR1_9LAMI